jgi:hypothetical protein
VIIQPWDEHALRDRAFWARAVAYPRRPGLLRFIVADSTANASPIVVALAAEQRSTHSLRRLEHEHSLTVEALSNLVGSGQIHGGDRIRVTEREGSAFQMFSARQKPWKRAKLRRALLRRNVLRKRQVIHTILNSPFALLWSLLEERGDVEHLDARVPYLA